MSDLKANIDELAAIAVEFNLTQVKLKSKDQNGQPFEISLGLGSQTPASAEPNSTSPSQPKKRRPAVSSAPSTPTSDAPQGTPITSPMTGVFYSSPSPGAPAFAKPGDSVQAGQVVGLIEAMKVFSEITATVSGTVTAITAENGKLVQPGNPLLYIQ